MSEHGSGERVGVITGDRLCAGCGYTLRSQPIVREPVYGLLMARCPECGVPAALQEYPLLRRGAGRRKLIHGAALLLILFGLSVVHSGIVMGLALAIREGISLDDSNRRIRTAWIQHDRAVRAEGKDLYPGQQVYRDTNGDLAVHYDWYLIDLAWWNASGRSLVGDLRPSWRAVRMMLLQPEVVVLLGLLVGLGALWSVLMFSRRAAWAASLMVLALVTVVAMLSLMSQRTRTGWDYSSALAREAIEARTLPVGLMLALAATAVGLLIGRPWARLVVRAALPPELRGSFAWLWWRSGLEPPRGAVGPSRVYPEVRHARERAGRSTHDEHARTPPV